MDKKISSSLMVIVSLIMGIYLFVYNDGPSLKKHIEQTLLPGMYHTVETKEQKNWNKVCLQHLLPLYQYWSFYTKDAINVEDEMTYEMIMAMQEREEEHMSEDLQEGSTNANHTSSVSLSMDKLRDFNYLVNHFYTVDSSTSVDENLINADKLLSKSMKINQESDGPKVLIYHTHSQESFVDSKAGDANTSIVGIGAYLAKLLNEKGVKTMHHDGVFDLINGKLDRSEAYQMAEKSISQILKENPSIEVVIDLHRDGVPGGTHLVTNVNGKQTAKIMFFNGISRTKSNGEITYLANPYLQDNLSFSLQMQLQCEELYPGFARRIYLRGYRYNLHLMPKSLLIEAGAQTNTVQEMKNAMDLLANVLYKVLL